MKKILFLLSSMNIGGTEKAFINMVSEPSFREMYDVTLMLLRKEGGFLDYIPEWIKVIELDGYADFSYELNYSTKFALFSRLKSLRFVSALKYCFYHLHFRYTKDRIALWKELAKKYNIEHSGHYDIAVSYVGTDNFMNWFILKYINANEKVQWIHCDVSEYVFHKYFAKKYYPLFDRIYTVSESSRDSLIAKLPLLKNKVQVYPNVFSPELCCNMANESSGFTDTFIGCRIVTVGRLSEEKGQLLILDIAEKLCKVGKKFRWYLIGDGPLREPIKSLIEEKQLSQAVILLGEKANPYPYIKQADLYVQPSLHEGYGLTVAEAKALNKFIIASDIPPFRSQLNGYNNSTVLHMDSDIFANEISKHIMR